MAIKERSQAPNVKVESSGLTNDERRAIEKAYDLASPNYKHCWKNASAPVPEPFQIVEENGERIENGISILCRVHRKNWDAKRKAESDKSLRAVKSLRNQDGTRVTEDNLVQFANPKRALIQDE